MSYRNIPFLGTTSTYIQFRARIYGARTAGKIIDMGVGFVPRTAASTGALYPLDGVYFRWGEMGDLRGVVSHYNSSGQGTAVLEWQTPEIIGVPPDGEFHYYMINYTWHSVEFWIDDILQAELEYPGESGETSPNGLASPIKACGGGPIIARVYIPNTTNAPAQIAPKVDISTICVTSCGEQLNKTAAEVAVSAWGGHCAQGPSGFTTLTNQANWVNNTEPTGVAYSNTTPGYTTLGGQWMMTAPPPASADTDYLLFSYLVPEYLTAQLPLNLYVTDIRIDSTVVGAAIATTPTLFEWAVGVGASASNLTTSDAGGSGVAHRRLPIGAQEFPLAAAIGYQPKPLMVNFGTPLRVGPHHYLGIIFKLPVSTATGTQQFRGVVMVNGYWGN